MSEMPPSLSRHGRAPRSDVRGIAAADTDGRNGFFISAAKDVINYLCDVQADLMKGVRVEMGLLPSGEFADGTPRMWGIDRPGNRVVLYRIPIERMAKLHRNDDWHRRNHIETVTISAIAELLETDPYDFAPNRFFPHA
jgi:hypothetical protein